MHSLRIVSPKQLLSGETSQPEILAALGVQRAGTSRLRNSTALISAALPSEK